MNTMMNEELMFKAQDWQGMYQSYLKQQNQLVPPNPGFLPPLSTPDHHRRLSLPAVTKTEQSSPFTYSNNMPYRTELKRPDLKGQFPCTVCGKIFCHSSSLSRHRMQAHFKSYTCNQCNSEISSETGNETLRSHMLKEHAISRLFMCRCCNWAFPDKTSLHIHMQSMMRNGHPGDVAVLARSSTEGPGMAGEIGELSPDGMDSPSSSPRLAERLSESPPLNNNNGIETPENGEVVNNRHHSNGSIFPSMPSREEMFTKIRPKTVAKERSQLPAAAAGDLTQQFLAAWLANNQSFPNPLVVGLQAQMVENSAGRVSCPLDDEEETENNAMASASPVGGETANNETVGARFSPSGNPMNSLLYKKKLNTVLRNKRKAARPQPLSSLMKIERPSAEDDVEQQQPAKKICATQPQEPLPMTNGYSNRAMQSNTSTGDDLNLTEADSKAAKCIDCQVMSNKLGVMENRIRFFESKVSSLEAKVGRLEKQNRDLDVTVKQCESDQLEARQQCESFESKLLECQEKAVSALGCLHKGPDGIHSVQTILQNLLECTSLFRNGKVV